MERESRVCGDEALMLWFTAGALDQDEAAEIGRHVESCPRCRELVQENEWLVRSYLSEIAPPAEHLPAEVLARIASGDEEMSSTEACAHVTTCDECSEIVSTVRLVDEDHGRGILGPLQNAWRSVSAWSLVRIPVPAYVFALALIVPAYLRLVAEPRVELAPALLSSPVTIASELERGPGEVAIDVDLQGGRTVLTFFVPVAPERFRYELELRTQTGRVLFTDRDATSFDGIGTFALSLPAGSLDTGDYEARIAEIGREAGELAETYVFPFSVGTR